MPVNPYDDRKVSLRWPHGNGDLHIVRASYTRRKTNVTEALSLLSGIFVLCPIYMELLSFLCIYHKASLLFNE